MHTLLDRNRSSIFFIYLSNLLLHCHCLIDGSYFGGLTYTYPVESIPAGQSIAVEAEDCYLGEAAVVRVSQDRGEE